MERTDYLSTEKISRLLMRFSLPTTMTLIVNSLYNLVDQMFIGWAQGVNGVAATNVAFPIGIIAASFALCIGDGCAANMSLLLGEGKDEEASRIFTNAVKLLVVVACLLAILGFVFVKPIALLFGASASVLEASMAYSRILMAGLPFSMFSMAFTAMIRADGNPKYMMKTMFLGAALNIVLDPIFIFKLQMGVQGAAIATIIGQVVSGTLALRYLPRFQTVKPNRKERMNVSEIIKILRLGFSSFCTQMATAVTQIVMNRYMSYYGGMSVYGSEVALSCYGIMMKIYQIAHAMFVGLASGTQPIHGYNFGAKQYRRVKETYVLAFRISLVVSIAWFGVFQLGGDWLARLFIKDDAVYLAFAEKCFSIYMMAFFVYGVPQVTSSFFQAIGKPRRALLMVLSRQIFFLLPMAFLMTRLSKEPLFGVLWAAPIADVLAFVLALVLIGNTFKAWESI